MKHFHGYVHKLGGIIVSHKVSLHEQDHFDLEGHEPANCGLCNEVCWLSPRAVIFSHMHPEHPVLCCGCAELGMDLVAQAIPGAHFLTKEVPDLAASGMFN